MVKQSIKKITSYLFALRLFRMSLSMVSLILSAKYFGVSLERDMWVLVATLIATVGGAVWGPVNETFRAKFILLCEREGKERAATYTVSLLVYIVIFTLIISIFILMLREQLAGLFSTNTLEINQLRLFCLLLIVMLPTLLINQLTSIGISILNAYNIYYIPELVGAFSSVMNIFIIVLLAPWVGILSLAVSQYFAILLLLAAVVFYLRKTGAFRGQTLQQVRFADFKVFLMFALPFFFPYFVGQCNSMVEKWLAGMLGQGVISTLDYARQFTSVLQNVLSSVLTTVMLPMLTKAYARSDKVQYGDILSENLTVCFGILALALPVLFGAASPLCEFFFMRGNITQEALTLIVSLTRSFAWAFMGVLIYILVGYSLLASEQGKKYAFWGVTIQLIVLILNLLLIDSLGVYTFPLTLGLVHLFGAVMMMKSLYVENKWKLVCRIVRYAVTVWSIAFALLAFNALFTQGDAFIRLLCNIPVLVALVFVCSPLLNIHLVVYLKKIKQKLCKNS